MIIKPVTEADYELIRRLNEAQNFRLKHLANTIIDRLVTDCKGNPIAYGIVKRMGEAIILTNPEAPRLSRAKAMTELMQYAEMGAVNAHCEQLHCFTDDERLAQALIKHFGFIKSDSIVLVKNL